MTTSLSSFSDTTLLRSFASLDISDILSDIEKSHTRYIKDNGRFNLSDALVLHCMIRTHMPKRLIEIGCGMSSCMILDTNERYCDNSIACTFIDIDTSAIRQFIPEKDLSKHTVIESPVQEVDTSFFTTLQEGDFLFVDSSHMYAPGTDVFDILHRILPALDSGVHIHIHDIFHDFRYPPEWNNTEWNEIHTIEYLLSHTLDYRIQFFSSHLSHQFPEEFTKTFPCLDYIHGGSLWLQKN